VWRYPKQMTWPSAVAATTLPLATAGEDVTGEAASVAVVGNLPLSCSDAGSIAQPLVEKRFKKPPVTFQRA
jgi:hypothetical protein